MKFLVTQSIGSVVHMLIMQYQKRVIPIFNTFFFIQYRCSCGTFKKKKKKDGFYSILVPVSTVFNLFEIRKLLALRFCFRASLGTTEDIIAVISLFPALYLYFFAFPSDGGSARF